MTSSRVTFKQLTERNHFPLEVLWNGWRSDTRTLEKAGWDIEVEVEECFRDRAFIHATTIGHPKYCPKLTRSYTRLHMPLGMIRSGDYTYDIIRYMEERGRAIIELDIEPQFGYSDIYRDLWMPEQELYIPDMDEANILKELLKKQYPNQQEIRERMKERESKEIITDQTKILQFVRL